MHVGSSDVSRRRRAARGSGPGGTRAAEPRGAPPAAGMEPCPRLVAAFPESWCPVRKG